MFTKPRSRSENIGPAKGKGESTDAFLPAVVAGFNDAGLE